MDISEEDFRQITNIKIAACGTKLARGSSREIYARGVSANSSEIDLRASSDTEPDPRRKDPFDVITQSARQPDTSRPSAPAKR